MPITSHVGNRASVAIPRDRPNFRRPSGAQCGETLLASGAERLRLLRSIDTGKADREVLAIPSVAHQALSVSPSLMPMIEQMRSADSTLEC